MSLETWFFHFFTTVCTYMYQIVSTQFCGIDTKKWLYETNFQQQKNMYILIYQLCFMRRWQSNIIMYDFFFHFCRQVPVPKLMWIIKPKPMLLLEKWWQRPMVMLLSLLQMENQNGVVPKSVQDVTNRWAHAAFLH